MVTAHKEYTKEFVTSFVAILEKHRTISIREYFVGMDARTLLDFAFALGIADEVLARNPRLASTEESNNALIKDLRLSVLEKVGR